MLAIPSALQSKFEERLRNESIPNNLKGQYKKLFFKLLEGVHQILKGRSLVDIMDIDVTNDSLFIDDQQSPFGNPIGTQHAIYFGYCSMGPEVGEDWKP